jgi:hypothetical protein
MSQLDKEFYFPVSECVKEDYNKMFKHGPLYDDTWHCTVCGQDMGSCNSRQLCRKTYCENQSEIDQLKNEMAEENETQSFSINFHNTDYMKRCGLKFDLDNKKLSTNEKKNYINRHFR